jgi:hypothetical protein
MATNCSAVAAAYLTRQAGGAPTLVVVDQFEQILTGPADELEALLALAHGLVARGAVVVLGLRADFYDKALNNRELQALTGGRQVSVPPMTDAELAEVIEGPPRKAGLRVEPGFVDLLIREIAARDSPTVAERTGLRTTRPQDWSPCNAPQADSMLRLLTATCVATGERCLSRTESRASWKPLAPSAGTYRNLSNELMLPSSTG